MITDEQKYIHALQASGLSAGEAKVYITVAKLGMAHISGIAREANIKRPTVYEYVNTLLQQDLIRKTIKGKRLYYFAENPESIIRTLEKRKQKIESVMPELTRIYIQSARKPSVRFYEGNKGLRSVYKEMTHTSKRLWSMFFADRYYTIFSEKDAEEFLKNIYKQGGELRDLVGNTPAGKEYVKESRAGVVGKSKLLPKDFIFTTDILVTGNKVAMISFENLVAFIVESEDVARLQEQMMRFIWKHI